MPSVSNLKGDYLTVNLGGDDIFTIDGTGSAPYLTYALVEVDVAAYANGTHTLLFTSSVAGGGDAVMNFFVDDVVLMSLQ
jgi:hypothetical protein